MRVYLLIATTFFLGIAILQAQTKYIKIENRKGKEKWRLEISDQLNYQLKGEDFVRTEYIEDIHGDGQVIVTNHNVVQAKDITTVRIPYEGSGVLGAILKGLGISFLTAGIASIIYEDTEWLAFPVGAGLYGAGLLLPKKERIKTIKTDRGYFVKVLDFENLGAQTR